MEVFVIILVFIARYVGNAIPLDTPLDNSHYVEWSGVSRYIWMPDDNNVPQLVDLHATIWKLKLKGSKNAADNEYWLFTRNNPTNRQVLVYGNKNSVHSSNYRANRQTKVIVHGWNSSGGSNMCREITSAFLAVGDFNVIVVDWNGVASGLYIDAVNEVPGIGRRIGDFISWLFNNIGGSTNQLHLVGFSMGAHIVGNAGRTLNGTPVRVTGLDPAGPNWPGNPNALNRNSGIYVESIHTDGGVLGIFDPISTADFYPNGGKNFQPGCITNACSHSRAYQYFASSIRTNHFIGRSCRNLSEAQISGCTGVQHRMGNTDLRKRGYNIFYFV